MLRTRSLLVALLAILSPLVFPLSASAVPAAKAVANRTLEIGFLALADHKDPFNDVTLDVSFTDPAGVKRVVPAFWAGGKSWKVRYASPLAGTHRFVSICSDKSDAGLNGVEGTVEVAKYVGDNPLYVHGPLTVRAGERFLRHADGTPFFWLGDTWWMGLTTRLAWPDEFAKLTADRKAKGFTVVQIVAGLYPDMPAFDPRGANEAGQPWEANYARIRPEYFDAADKKINHLVEQGIVPCVVGAWGFHLPWLGVEKMGKHQRYVYARWGSLPIVWCGAGELSLPFYLSPGFPNNPGNQIVEWRQVLGYMRSINAFGRLVTSHPNGIAPNSIKGFLGEPTLVDFDMLQTPHGQLEAVGPSVTAARRSYAAKPVMPIVNAEPSYEMLFDRTPASVTRRVFWGCWASGITGYTYGANGIWQLNRKDKPYGNSPWGGGYGKISWDEAMHLPGSAQVAMAKKLLTEYPWQTFEPHQEWASWAGDPVDVKLGDWVWYPEGDPTVDAPLAARTFRRSFDLPEGTAVTQAALAVTADDHVTVWLNGEELGSSKDWHQPVRANGIEKKLKPGKNVIAVRAENVKSDNVVKNPAGMAFGLTAELAGGKRVTVASDAEWQASREEPAGWQKPTFDAAAWEKAKVIAPQGGGPWGAVSAGGKGDAFAVPYAFGAADGVRFVYVPGPGVIAVKGLKPDGRYDYFQYDPVNGRRTKKDAITMPKDGPWHVEPAGIADDWVLVMEPKK